MKNRCKDKTKDTTIIRVILICVNKRGMSKAKGQNMSADLQKTSTILGFTWRAFTSNIFDLVFELYNPYSKMHLEQDYFSHTYLTNASLLYKEKKYNQISDDVCHITATSMKAEEI